MITQDIAQQTAVAFIDDIKKHLGLSQVQIAQMLGTAEEDYNPAVGWVWEFNSKLGTVTISKKNGTVVSYFDDDELDSIGVSVSMEDAEKEIKRFLSKVYPDLEEDRFEEVRKEVDEGSYEFEYEEQAQTGEYSIFHNYLSVSVRGDIARVVSFDRSALEFVRTTPPKIDLEKAKKIAKGLMSEGGKIIHTSLYEHPIDEAKDSMTVWAIGVEYNFGGLESLEMITLNADTGAEVDVDELEREVE